MLRLAPLVGAALVLAALPLAVGDPEPPFLFAPTAAIAAISNHGVMIAWVPGAETPDSFNIYSLTGETPVLLATTPGSAQSVHVPRSQAPPCTLEARGSCIATMGPTYGVSATKNGIESAVTTALGLGVCITFIPDVPPDVAVGSCSNGLLPEVRRIDPVEEAMILI